MTVQPFHRQAVEMLLAAITQKMGDDGLMSSFFFSEPGTAFHLGRMGTQIYYHDRELTLAILYVRKHGPIYLRYLPIDEIRSMLQNFVINNFWYLADECWLNRFSGTYAANVSDRTKEKLALALAECPIFNPMRELNLFPLVTVTVQKNFESSNFFLVAPETLDHTHLPAGFPKRAIVGGQFPPIEDWEGKVEMPSAWLGIHSPAPLVADKQKAAILGALALTPLPSYRHLFSGRKMFGGQCTISGSITTRFGDPHTPPMMYNILVDVADHEWLALLSKKLSVNERAIRRQLRALEYFYRAWSLTPSERFPVLCMSLEAIFGEAVHATQAVIDGVRSVVGPHVEDIRLRKLMTLRAAVIHGGAPDVYDSSKYDEYYADYVVDPIRDMELIVARCLRDRIFEGKLKEHVDPMAGTIKAAQASGRLPVQLERPTILGGASGVE